MYNIDQFWNRLFFIWFFILRNKIVLLNMKRRIFVSYHRLIYKKFHNEFMTNFCLLFRKYQFNICMLNSWMKFVYSSNLFSTSCILYFFLWVFISTFFNYFKLSVAILFSSCFTFTYLISFFDVLNLRIWMGKKMKRKKWKKND